ncbi:MAG TPA: ribosome biogenesis GTPase YlqF [Candidatus Dormibacteraeota bacterium]|nr:ribosome biogenesis GTPase YlqF [Candidatus Dormibacteraeota bacterium]
MSLPPIQWFPGHMAAAMRDVARRLESVDVVVEVRDARLPLTSANPALAALIGRREHLLVLAKEDLAEPDLTARWIARLTRGGLRTVAVHGKEQRSVQRLQRLLSAAGGGRPSVRAMVLGIPNVGKSSVINGLLRRAAAKTEDRPGVTRDLRWFRVSPRLELMDTPGVLVPKIDTPEAQWKLALCGAVPMERFDLEAVIASFGAWLTAHPGHALAATDLTAFAVARGCVRRGGLPDLERAATIFLRDFNQGKLGRFTLDLPDEAEAP